jgi:hypothetical protein
VITLAFVTFALFLLDWALAWGIRQSRPVAVYEKYERVSSSLNFLVFGAWAWYLHGPLLWLAAAYAGVQLCGALLVGKTRLPTKTEWKGEVDG